MANRFPLIVDSDTSTVKELPSGDNLNLTGNDAIFGDNDAILMGAGTDLKIFHNGSNSQINDLGTGKLQLLSNGTGVDILKTDGEIMATFVNDGAVTLYYDNASKLATDTSGVTVTGRAKGTVTADNDSAFDLNASNMFTCTPTGTIDLTFTNETAGVSGMIYFNNGSNYTVTAGADVHISTDDLTALSATGTYIVTFYCPDGTNVYLSASAALTEGS